MAVQLLDDDDIKDVTDAELVPDGDKDTVYSVRHLTTEKHRALVKQNTRKAANRRLDDVVDLNKLADDLLDYVLVGWKGVLKKGEPVPCERAFKLKLDTGRKGALIESAGLSEVLAAGEDRAASFPAV